MYSSASSDIKTSGMIWYTCECDLFYIRVGFVVQFERMHSDINEQRKQANHSS